MKLTDRIIQARIEKEWNKQQLANKIGVHISTVTNWENGHRKPKKEHRIKLADLFNKPLSYFLDDASIDLRNDSKITIVNGLSKPVDYVPMGEICLDHITTVKAGSDTLMIEDTIEKFYIDKSWLPDEARGMTDEQIRAKYKVVTVEGNSMYPEYNPGDKLIAEKTNGNIINGKKYIIIIGHSAIVKKVYKTNDSVTLVSINDKDYPPRKLTPKDFELEHITIEYRVVRLIRDE